MITCRRYRWTTRTPTKCIAGAGTACARQHCSGGTDTCTARSTAAHCLKRCSARNGPVSDVLHVLCMHVRRLQAVGGAHCEAGRQCWQQVDVVAESAAPHSAVCICRCWPTKQAICWQRLRSLCHPFTETSICWMAMWTCRRCRSAMCTMAIPSHWSGLRCRLLFVQRPSCSMHVCLARHTLHVSGVLAVLAAALCTCHAIPQMGPAGASRRYGSTRWQKGAPQLRRVGQCSVQCACVCRRHRAAGDRCRKRDSVVGGATPFLCCMYDLAASIAAVNLWG